MATRLTGPEKKLAEAASAAGGFRYLSDFVRHAVLRSARDHLAEVALAPGTGGAIVTHRHHIEDSPKVELVAAP